MTTTLDEIKEEIEKIVWGNFGNIFNAMEIDKATLVKDLSILFSQQIFIAEERGYEVGFMNGAEKGFTKEKPILSHKSTKEK